MSHSFPTRRSSDLATGNTIGLDVGLKSFYTDSNGLEVENPRFYRVGEVKMRRSQRLVYRKVKGSKNRHRSRIKLGRIHLKISRQRKDHAVKLARCVITSNECDSFALNLQRRTSGICLGNPLGLSSHFNPQQMTTI